MKFASYLTEFNRDKYGLGITFVDIDETIFRTFARVLVKVNGVVTRELNNQDFNSYVLKDNEEFDFQEFRSASIFKKTSIPIPKTITRVKNMLSQIKIMDSGSKIIFLTARADFDDKEAFLSIFKKYGIDMSKPTVYVERVGNIKSGTISSKKKKVMLEYIKTGLYRRVRLIDDHVPNVKELIIIKNNLPKEIEKKVIKTYDLDMSVETLPPISFYPLWVKEDGTLELV